jgi:sRNA-binding protein
VGIEAVRAVVGLLDREQAEQVRSALSQVQVLYAKHAGEGEAKAGEAEPADAEQPPATEKPAPSGPQRGPSKLWTPPGT